MPVASLDHPGQGLDLISESKKGFGRDGWWSSTKSMGRKPRVIKQPLVATRGERRGAQFPGRGEMRLPLGPKSLLGGRDVLVETLIQVVRLRVLLRHWALLLVLKC
ncbi:hypothetical protein BHM03_00038446 [Ensete ventricosum]|nr:hypothetical protein BHM03_00038446 [Ensete ventricosum]